LQLEHPNVEWALRNRRRLKLQIQREINIEGLHLHETEAGQELMGIQSRRRIMLEQELRELEAESEETVKMGDQECTGTERREKESSVKAFGSWQAR
jgi:hypothetical protein